ncbi:MAG: DUF4240 domain-containing protein [Saprospiraceae bacterium]|jgi:hypothetical protein|nr:DUF4240 domain-containing protein [Saprospiraceae bacterium]
MPLRALNPAVIRDLQEKYPEAEMHIVMAGAPDEATPMNEERFWNIISLLDWSKEGNDDAVIEPAVRELSRLPESAILSFYDLLSEKLYLLDGRQYAEHSVLDDESISSDLFLYARCSVVANGRDFYEEVLKNPPAFPKDLYFEAMLDIPERAWFRKTGNQMEHLPKYIYETGFNPNGWGADTITL